MKEDFPHKIEASWRASLKDAENDATGVTCQFGPNILQEKGKKAEYKEALNW